MRSLRFLGVQLALDRSIPKIYQIKETNTTLKIKAKLLKITINIEDLLEMTIYSKAKKVKN